MRRVNRVLIISYYFPPAGGAGSKRITSFVRYLPEFGWQPITLTTAGGIYPFLDRDLTRTIPGQTPVIRTRTWSPFSLYAQLSGRPVDETTRFGFIASDAETRAEKMATWIRANLFLPDARVGWLPFAVQAATRILKRYACHAAITTGPPHSTHLVGLMLHRLHNLPWIADFRDPWQEINYRTNMRQNGLAQKIEQRMERWVLNNATATITVSPSWRDMLAAKLPGVHRDSIVVVANGYEEEFFSVQPPLSDDFFLLSHIGSLYQARNPVGLWQTLSRLHKAAVIPRLRLHLVGRVDRSVVESIHRCDLHSITELVPPLSHRLAIGRMAQSHLLLLLIEDFPENTGMITAKLYEYLASGRPVLGLGPPHGDAANLVRRVQGGTFFDPTDTENVSRYLLAHYHAWEKGRPLSGAPRKCLSPYSRRSQCRRLANILDSVCHHAGTTA